MGCGRKGPVDQSHKKQRIFKSPQRENEKHLWVTGLRTIDEKAPLLVFTDALIDEMKRMNPQEVANILLSKEI